MQDIQLSKGIEKNGQNDHGKHRACKNARNETGRHVCCPQPDKVRQSIDGHRHQKSSKNGRARDMDQRQAATEKNDKSSKCEGQVDGRTPVAYCPGNTKPHERPFSVLVTDALIESSGYTGSRQSSLEHRPGGEAEAPKPQEHDQQAGESSFVQPHAGVSTENHDDATGPGFVLRDYRVYSSSIFLICSGIPGP